MADAPPATWHAALRGIVSRVRAFLAETGLDPRAVLPGGRGGYRLLLPTSAQVDVEVAVDSVVAAERELRRGHWPAAVRQAETARMIAGRPVLSDEDHPRLMACRRELADVLVRALLAGSEAHERAGDHARAMAAAADAVAAAPFVEAAYLRLVDAHTASGNRAAALRADERCRRLLADELGTRPSPELEARYFALLEDAGSAGPAGAHATCRTASAVAR